MTFRKNKLDRFVTGKLFSVRSNVAGKAGALCYNKTCRKMFPGTNTLAYFSTAIGSHANIRLGRKISPGTNTLAYLSTIICLHANIRPGRKI